MGQRPVQPSERSSYILEQAERQAHQRIERMEELRKLHCFQDVSEEEFEHFVDLCVLRVFSPGETILREQSSSEFLYVVLHGSVQFVLYNQRNEEMVACILKRGDCFGEEALFNPFPQRVMIRAETRCYTLQLSLTAIRALLPATPLFGEVKSCTTTSCKSTLLPKTSYLNS